MDEIRRIHRESHDNYVAPKIASIMNRNGDTISEKTVGNYMREMGIKAQYIKHRTRTTISENFSNDLKNILDEKFNPSKPNAVWCSDITYIYTMEGFVYLTSIMDLYSRKIIAWTISDTLEAKHVVTTIEKAMASRHITAPLVIHSDRGIQYTCNDYLRATDGMILSYSKKAYPWDNACIESFHSLLKR